MHQVSMSRTVTAHELDSPEGQTVSSPAVQANGWPIQQSPPAYDPNVGQLPLVTKQPPAPPQELPGSTYIHEHHPAFTPTGSSVGSVATPTEVGAGSEPRTPSENKSPVLSAATPRTETQSPVFVSPLGSPRLAKTE